MPTLTIYAYDALGQLIRVNDPHENATWVYTYDRGGNILNKTRYAFTTGTLRTALETVPYTYGDANWKDKLTAYNGQTITYDAIGNPLNDGERVYTWGACRQLKHVSRRSRVPRPVCAFPTAQIQKARRCCKSSHPMKTPC